MRFRDFIGRIAPLFHAFELVPGFSFKMMNGNGSRFFSGMRKFSGKENTRGKGQKKLYCRRLTRTMENYAKD